MCGMRQGVQQDKRIFCKLSVNHKQLLCVETEKEEVPREDALLNSKESIEIADIKGLTMQSLVQSVQKKKLTADSISRYFAITLKNDEMREFVAPEGPAFNVWMDGLHHLLNMELPFAKEDLDSLVEYAALPPLAACRHLGVMLIPLVACQAWICTAGCLISSN